jgi:hypothetical protein
MMARGWESKSVEEQQAEARAASTPKNRPVSREEAAKRRQQEGLTLSRQRVLEQLRLAQNPAHRRMLEKALADLDTQLERLG